MTNLKIFLLCTLVLKIHESSILVLKIIYSCIFKINLFSKPIVGSFEAAAVTSTPTPGTQ